MKLHLSSNLLAMRLDFPFTKGLLSINEAFGKDTDTKRRKKAYCKPHSSLDFQFVLKFARLGVCPQLFAEVVLCRYQPRQCCQWQQHHVQAANWPSPHHTSTISTMPSTHFNHLRLWLWWHKLCMPKDFWLWSRIFGHYSVAKFTV